jgi:hypothetical protein
LAQQGPFVIGGAVQQGLVGLMLLYQALQISLEVGNFGQNAVGVVGYLVKEELIGEISGDVENGRYLYRRQQLGESLIVA